MTPNEQLQKCENEFDNLINTLNTEINQDLRNQYAQDASRVYETYRTLMKEVIAK